jgi:uncharacterized cupredoxin-like copper-binding protein
MGPFTGTPRIRIVTLVALAAFVVSGCAAEGDESAVAGGTAIDVQLQEWAVVVSEDSASAGEITFTITNDGPEDVHEFVVVATDLDAGDLPTDETGAVTEEGEGIEVVDEVEDIPIGETEELVVSLDAGHYVLICNIYSEDEDEAHYAMGMRTNFTVDE